jgi:hypothetical protein
LEVYRRRERAASARAFLKVSAEQISRRAIPRSARFNPKSAVDLRGAQSFRREDKALL